MKKPEQANKSEGKILIWLFSDLEEIIDFEYEEEINIQHSEPEESEGMK